MLFSIVFICSLQIIIYNAHVLFASNDFNTFNASNVSNESNEFNAPDVPNVIFTYNASKVVPPICSSRIYCDNSNESIMHYMHFNNKFDDSKIFVDQKLKYSEAVILNNFKILKENNNNKVPSNLSDFLRDNFDYSNEFEPWVPPDYNESPPSFDRIIDTHYKTWANFLNVVWKSLSKKVMDDVRINQDLYSLLWVPNGFIVPGGRFRELYYWDTYWIINGLLVCNMTTTVRGIIDNIILLVDQNGFMPNGARKYYLNRSQPPLLIQMVLNYYIATNDFNYIKDNINILEKEFAFWTQHRTITFNKNNESYTMFRYYAPSTGPRPESYYEDYLSAKMYKTQEQKEDYYNRIKSGTESGWDFSSRWFITANGSDHGVLSDTQTPNIVPVDLNSILHRNAVILSDWFMRLGSITKAQKYDKTAKDILNNIEKVMWRQDIGTWYDWDVINNKSREYFFVSNIAPLWTRSYCHSKTENISSVVLNYLKSQKVIEADYSIKFKGTPASMYQSSQQWDYHNAWPPLQAFIIQGLYRTRQNIAQKVATRLAEVWLRASYKGFTNSYLMFEKLDSLAAGKSGIGGEYKPQDGFGWTNGIILEFLYKWGNSFTYDSDDKISTITNIMVNDGFELASNAIDDISGNFTADMSC